MTFYNTLDRSERIEISLAPDCEYPTKWWDSQIKFVTWDDAIPGTNSVRSYMKEFRILNDANALTNLALHIKRNYTTLFIMYKEEGTIVNLHTAPSFCSKGVLFIDKAYDDKLLREAFTYLKLWWANSIYKYTHYKFELVIAEESNLYYDSPQKVLKEIVKKDVSNWSSEVINKDIHLHYMDIFKTITKEAFESILNDSNPSDLLIKSNILATYLKYFKKEILNECI